MDQQTINSQSQQNNINKLADWIKANQKYSPEELRISALRSGFTEEDFTVALRIANNSVANLAYKGVGIRSLAFFIDMVVLGIVFWIFAKVFSEDSATVCNSSFSLGFTFSVNSQPKAFYGLCGLSAQLYFLTIFAYYVLSEWKLGGTLGKLALGLRVVKANGEPLDLKASFIRNMLRFVDFFPFFYFIGAFSIFSSKTKQRIGDRLAKTVVVSKNSLDKKRAFGN